MTDLEQTGAELSQQRYLLECARQEERERQESAHNYRLNELLAAARREGAEGEFDRGASSGKISGAAEMRERAARALPHYSASVVRALPLTPEEPERD